MLKLLVIMILASTLSLGAQHDHAAGPHTAGDSGTNSLTGEQVRQLLEGDGMGLAKPAELNQYPGPKHVLELASDLRLSVEQRRDIEAIRTTMLATARHLGAQIVAAERSLDEAFRSAEITETQLRELTMNIARLQGDLRAAHLAAHLQSRRRLTEEQVSKYEVLRGYRKE
jgi:hypothetical protein